MAITLTPKLKTEYLTLFNDCHINPDKQKTVDKIRQNIVAKQAIYQQVEVATSVPWFVIGIIHSLEASLNFKTHLHNGDPLTAKTVHVPKGRPAGEPPFTWEQSAIDALAFDNLTSVKKWPLSTLLFRLEGFNGFGYRMRHPEVLTPYLWSFTNHYKQGKFVGDGQFDPDTVSDQAGAAALLKSMLDANAIVVAIS